MKVVLVEMLSVPAQRNRQKVRRVLECVLALREKPGGWGRTGAAKVDIARVHGLRERREGQQRAKGLRKDASGESVRAMPRDVPIVILGLVVTLAGRVLAKA